MEEKVERISYLIFVYLKKSITPAEQQELDVFINSSPTNAAYFSEITHKGAIEKLLAEYDQPNKARIWQQVTLQVPEATIVPLYKQIWWRYAAAAIVVLGVGSWLYLTNSSSVKTSGGTELVQSMNDVAPGGNKATLTLANGKRIVLDSAANGLLALEGETKIAKRDNTLAYNTATPLTAHADLTYNTISTPRGGQYQLELPDGSKVWLNASSSLRFPTSFTSDKRVVELTGEGYFEIASLYRSPGNKQHKVPFIVAIHTAAGENKGSVEVLGTHFDIMAYNKDAIQTTLTEGSVKVATPGGQSSMLRPGQQAQLPGSATTDKKILINDHIDIEEVLAWKNGLFTFNNASIQTIMEHVSRWYDVDVIFEQDTDMHFSFQLQRGLPVSKLLKILELTGSIHFKIEDRKITVVR